MLAEVLDGAGFVEKYASAVPFAHAVIDDALSTEMFAGARAELETMEFTAKETDLYRFAQTPDLSRVGAQYPHLSRLRDFLYHVTMRTTFSAACGCGPLSDKVDMAGAVYASGSHLLVHDDVIGSRKIAFIIYFTDPADDWSATDGGCLELYDSYTVDGVKFPQLYPQTRILPLPNRVAFFTVESGSSFHAVQEVLAIEKNRISIQGWYHSVEASSLSGSSVRELRKQINLEGFVPSALGIPEPSKLKIKKTTLPLPTISDDDLDTLQQLGVHPMYLDRENLAMIGHAMRKEAVVRLAQFIVPPLSDPLTAALKAVDDADGLGLGQGVPSNSAGQSAAWRGVGPAHVRRYLELITDEEKPHKAHRSETSDEFTSMLRLVQQNLFQSNAFTAFVLAIAGTSTQGQVTHRRDSVARFRPGLDYSLATLPAETTEIDVRLTFCNAPEADDEESEEENGDEDSEAEDLWASCEVGGFDSYILATEGDASVAASDAEAVTNLPCQSNTLTIAVRSTAQMHFVKYVQSVAPSSRVEVSTTFKLSAYSRSSTLALYILARCCVQSS
jgi:Rps23 Pro-64 3,4-dihydroxylase Tpa1-like proline 4-hydroxylase